MGIDVRRVPATWRHPKDQNGHFLPRFDNFKKALAEAKVGFLMWSYGLRQDHSTKEWIPIEDEYKGLSFKDWDNGKPEKQWYTPDWKPEERTHYQIYENVTEGTPISPVFKSPEKLAKWMEKNCEYYTCTYEVWLEQILTNSGRIGRIIATI